MNILPYEPQALLNDLWAPPNGSQVLLHELQVCRMNRKMLPHKPQILLHEMQMLAHESEAPPREPQVSLAGALKFVMILGF